MTDHFNEIDYDDYEDDNCGDCGKCEDCWDEMMQECGLQADGSCLLAGSEHCDWDCRMRDLDEEEDDDDDE